MKTLVIVTGSIVYCMDDIQRLTGSNPRLKGVQYVTDRESLNRVCGLENFRFIVWGPFAPSGNLTDVHAHLLAARGVEVKTLAEGLVWLLSPGA